MESTTTPNNNSQMNGDKSDDENPNMIQFLHKYWKWLEYDEGAGQEYENRIWSQDPLVINHSYNILVHECMKSIDEFDHEKLSLFSKYYDTDLASQTKEHLKTKVNCVDLTEKMFLKKFKSEYYSFYECRNTCVWKYPRGFQNSISRQRCYRECNKIFDQRLSSFVMKMATRYNKEGLMGLGDIVNEKFSANIDEEFKKLVES